MATLISLVAFIVICLLFIEFRKRKNSKLGDSVLYIIIERHYKKWYSYNATIINKKTTTLYEVDKVLFELKRTLEGEGIQKDELGEYVVFLEGNDNQLTFSLKDVFLALMTFLSTNSIVKKLLPAINYQTFKEWLTKVPKIPNEYQEIVAIIVAIMLLLLLFGLLIWCMYKISTIDNLYKDRQRASLLKRLKKIWDYSSKNEITEVSQITELGEDSKNTVFIDLNFSRTRLEKRLDNSIGQTIGDNILFLSSKCKKIIKWLEAFLDWLLGFTISGLMFFLIMFFIAANPFKHVGLIENIFIIIISMMFVVFYISQLNVYSENADAIKRDSSKEYGYKLAKVVRNWPSWIILLLYLAAPFILFMFGILTLPKFLAVCLGLIIVFPIRVEKYEQSNHRDESLAFRTRFKNLKDMYFESWKDNTINKLKKEHP